MNIKFVFVAMPNNTNYDLWFKNFLELWVVESFMSIT